jgi:hypothetical protein
MAQQFKPDPAEFQRCVNILCMKIETIAMRSGVSDADCADLEGTLAAMPPLVRDRVKLMLNGIEIQTEYDEPVMAFSARYLLRLAHDVWQMPHPLTHSPSASRRSLTRR